MLAGTVFRREVRQFFIEFVPLVPEQGMTAVAEGNEPGMPDALLLCFAQGEVADAVVNAV